MKKLILLMVFAISFRTFASEQNMSMEVKNMNFYPWRSSVTTCAAATRCTNGRPIACRVFGYAYNSMPGGFYNSCSWRVIPGRMVHCQGYQKIYNPIYRMYMWQWVNIPVRCY